MAPLIATVLVFLSVSGFVLAVIRLAGTRREVLLARLSPYAPTTFSPPAAGVDSILRGRSFSAIPWLQGLLSNGAYAEGVATSLAEAGLRLRVGEYVLLRAVAALTPSLLAYLLGMPLLVAVPVGLVGFQLPRFYVSNRQNQRLRRFDDTLVDALLLMANSLKSGSGFLQAMDQVAREMPPPLSEEFARVVGEVGIGSSVETALENLTLRIRSYDLYLVVTAILVQRQTGGSLAEILDKIGFTIRERIRLLRQVQVLTAQERLSAIIVGALPLVLLGALSVITPTYYGDFLAQPIGRVLLGVAFAFEGLGFLLMKHLGKIDV